MESSLCDTLPCTGTWGSWSLWPDCQPSSCGVVDIVARKRSCLDEMVPCVGRGREMKTCPVVACKNKQVVRRGINMQSYWDLCGVAVCISIVFEILKGCGAL